MPIFVCPKALVKINIFSTKALLSTLHCCRCPSGTPAPGPGGGSTGDAAIVYPAQPAGCNGFQIETNYADSCPACTIQPNGAYSNVAQKNVATVAACVQICASTASCNAATYNPGRKLCYLKDRTYAQLSGVGVVNGWVGISKYALHPWYHISAPVIWRADWCFHAQAKYVQRYTMLSLTSAARAPIFVIRTHELSIYPSRYLARKT